MPQQAHIKVSERLPFHIISDCDLLCDYFVRSFQGYYLVTLHVSGVVPTRCLRCLEVFEYDYVNHTELAACRNEETAEKMMEDYECIVFNQHEIDLASILTDDLHLYVPEKHMDLIGCHHQTEFSIENNG